MIAEQAGHYRAIPLLWALLAALATPWPLLWLTALSASRIFLIQLARGAGAEPRPVLAEAALRPGAALHQACAGHMRRPRASSSARGLTRTREKTGVLIYLALAEHHAEILADTGIADRVDAGIWAGIVADLTAAIGAGRLTEGLIEAIRRIGAILAEHAPPRLDDVDELPDKVIILP